MARGWYGNITNGGDIFSIQSLNPNIVYPQHYPNSPVNYKLFAYEAIEKGIEATFSLAEKQSNDWFYSHGTITKIENETRLHAHIVWSDLWICLSHAPYILIIPITSGTISTKHRDLLYFEFCLAT